MEALKLLSNCLEDVEALQYVRETGGLQTLLKFVTTPTLPEVQSSAVKAITKAAQHCRCTRLTGFTISTVYFQHTFTITMQAPKVLSAQWTSSVCVIKEV